MWSYINYEGNRGGKLVSRQCSTKTSCHQDQKDQNMGSGASKKESDDDQEIDTGEFEPIKNHQGEIVGLRQRTKSEKSLRRQKQQFDDDYQKEDYRGRNEDGLSDHSLSSRHHSASKSGSSRSRNSAQSHNRSSPSMQSKSSLKSSHSTTTETSPDERSSARSQNIRRRNQTRSANQRNKKWVRVKRSYHPVKYKEPHGTIRPNPNWFSKSTAIKLDKAMDGIGTDEETIIDILCNCNQSQRSQLKQSFKSITKEDLLLVMREELSGNFLELSLAMLREPLAFHIDLINVLLKDESRLPTLVGFMVQKTRTELNEIAEKFQTLFHQTIEEKIRQETSGDFSDVLLSILERKSETGKENGGPRALANILMRGTEDPDFKQALLEVFKISEPAEIRETCEAIRQMYQADLIDVIADTVDQDRQSEPYKAAIAACDDTSFFFAGCLQDALKKKDHDCIIRLIAGRAEIDLDDISEAYEEMFSVSLSKVIYEKIATGDYRELLLRILNPEKKGKTRKK